MALPDSGKEGDAPAPGELELAATPIGLAETIHAALVADDPDAHIEPLGLSERVSIDGRFDLERVAKRILKVLGKSTPQPGVTR